MIIWDEREYAMRMYSSEILFEAKRVVLIFFASKSIDFFRNKIVTQIFT